MNDHPDDTSPFDSKKPKPQVLEILMDVKSTTSFVDIASDILIQLGIPSQDTSQAKGTMFRIFLNTIMIRALILYAKKIIR